jgi:hypothetical protein
MFFISKCSLFQNVLYFTMFSPFYGGPSTFEFVGFNADVERCVTDCNGTGTSNTITPPVFAEISFRLLVQIAIS